MMMMMITMMTTCVIKGERAVSYQVYNNKLVELKNKKAIF